MAAPLEGPAVRVAAVLDQLVAERERANRAAVEVGEQARGTVPSIREVQDALFARYGQGLSFRNLVPEIDAYMRLNNVAGRLPPKPGQRITPAEREGSEADVPPRIRKGVDRIFGSIATQREGLAKLLEQEVAMQTEGLQRQVASLKDEITDLERQLGDRPELMSEADRAEAETAELRERLNLEERARLEAEARVAACESEVKQARADHAAAVSEAAAASARAVALESELAEARAELRSAQGHADLQLREALASLSRATAALEDRRSGSNVTRSGA
ncbi:hypothetical protein APZ41_005335 [Roseomonas mucosa]|uniref:KfrA N-terminal DNA-binding domain-containing protein n=1 Tax=Roseomonas mucosa TaxID=207340 RepID=A0A1S8D796_9PROT|nr:hypothetical protein [Roseomonas mucosa]ONH84236.1 hypothetical protein APZ41_005335 [Roseomonas mucosa]